MGTFTRIEPDSSAQVVQRRLAGFMCGGSRELSF